MENDFRLVRPGTYVEGKDFLLKECLHKRPVLVPVKFIAYDPSPPGAQEVS
jgi:hypothetical protein